MARGARGIELFPRYRFAIHLKRTDTWLGAQSVESMGPPPEDGPEFKVVSQEGQRVRITTGCYAGREVLAKYFSEERVVSVWMLPRERGGVARETQLRYGAVEWLPFALDARETGVATESVVLKKVIYEHTREVPFDELPTFMKDAFPYHRAADTAKTG